MTQIGHNGGPAFPLQSIGPDFAPGYGGMHLRDFFAGQALTAATMYQTMDPHELAKDAYRIADAMLAEREADQ